MRPSRNCQSQLTTLWEVQDKHFENVYNKYYGKIYGICRRYSSKSDDAKDLAHDVFVRYFQNFEKFRHESSPVTWMYRVAINLGIHKWRKERTQYRIGEDLESLPSCTEDTEVMLLDRVTLTKILSRFPERTQKILTLHYFEKMTQTEIGKVLGISRATVIRQLVHFKRSNQHRLKSDLRQGARGAAGLPAVSR